GLPLALEPAATVPDALVGQCWPAIFAVVGAAKTRQGDHVAEGVLDLVHLDHVLISDTDPSAISGAAQITAELISVEDTDMGRVLTIHARIVQDETVLVELRERLAIVGRRGAATLADPPVAGGLDAFNEATRRTH